MLSRVCHLNHLYPYLNIVYADIHAWGGGGGGGRGIMSCRHDLSAGSVISERYAGAVSSCIMCINVYHDILQLISLYNITCNNINVYPCMICYITR